MWHIVDSIAKIISDMDVIYPYCVRVNFVDVTPVDAWID